MGDKTYVLATILLLDLFRDWYRVMVMVAIGLKVMFGWLGVGVRVMGWVCLYNNYWPSLGSKFAVKNSVIDFCSKMT